MAFDASNISAMFRLADVEVFVAQGVVFAFIAACTVVGAVHPRLRHRPRIRSAIHGWWPVSIVATLGNHGGTWQSLYPWPSSPTWPSCAGRRWWRWRCPS
jgi:hypothetical protein